MTNLVSAVRARVESPERRKFIKYSLASVISVVTTEIILFVCAQFLGQSGGWASFEASTIAAFPSYYLNRYWVWGKTGRSHFRKEVLPFWIMAFIGIGFSALIGIAADGIASDISDSKTLQHVFYVLANVLAFGVLWIIKFVIFNKILFAHREDELDPALDGRTGLPT